MTAAFIASGIAFARPEALRVDHQITSEGMAFQAAVFALDAASCCDAEILTAYDWQTIGRVAEDAANTAYLARLLAL